MVALIVDRERCGQDLATELKISGATVSHHLKVLRDAGLLKESRQSPYTFFSLDHKALQLAVRSIADKQQVSEMADEGQLPDKHRKVLRAFFDGPRLVAIPAQHKKKEIVLEEVLRRLPRRKEYGERTLSRYIEGVFEDFCTIRREFVRCGYMVRDNGRYQLTERGRAVVG
jgi:biotin operon repressor